jgi:transcriptional regulator with XRE-family HTH domain
MKVTLTSSIQEQRDLVRRLFFDGTVRRVRTEQRRAQTDCAAQAGVDGSCWSRWENGRRVPRGDRADRAANVVAELLEEASR